MNKLFLSVLFLTGFLSFQISAQIKVKNLQCEHLQNPIGLDEPRPRFTWQIQSEQPGYLQEAFQLVVGTDKAPWRAPKILPGFAHHLFRWFGGNHQHWSGLANRAQSGYFQYVEVTSDQPLELTKESLIAYFMHSDVPPVGKIHSSNNTLNKIWEAANAFTCFTVIPESWSRITTTSNDTWITLTTNTLMWDCWAPKPF